MTRTLSVPQQTAPLRLDRFLAGAVPQTSRQKLQRAIKQGIITVNGRAVTPHQPVKGGEIINLPPDIETPSVLAPKPNLNIALNLVAETQDYLVVDKPAGLTVHPAPGVTEPTLVEGLLARFPELAKVGEDALRPGIVHRLDKEVSGVMVVARTPEMYAHLKTQFAERTVEKHYLALVIGRVSQPDGTINFPLARSKRSHAKIAARPNADQDTKTAVTHYTVKQRFQPATLLDVSIETGRTHQIRAHLAALGYPIVGDLKYRPRVLKFKATPGRLFLHSAQLTFTDLSRSPQTFTSQLPQALTDFLAKLV